MTFINYKKKYNSVNNNIINIITNMKDNEFTGPGSVTKVFEAHYKNGLDASGNKYVTIFVKNSPAPNVIMEPRK